MEINEFLELQVNTTTGKGPLKFGELREFTARGLQNGVAVAPIGKGRIYLLFRKGEPEGAVMLDEHGILVGDKAVFLLKGGESFEFHTADPEAIDLYILSCRIFDKSHMTHNISRALPTIERKNEGTGAFVIRILRGQVPQAGLHVSMRTQGRVVGSDVTTPEGKAYFKVLFGDYDCVVMDRERKIRVFPVKVHTKGSEVTVDIS